MTAYYNENDSFAAQWLRNLIAAGHITPGEVDERDIRDVTPNELSGYTQCHFFAGVGVWSYALRQAGWPDDRPIWTGSCPCQPFSAAGRGTGFADERHLWPHWFHLIDQRRPGIVFGEQIAARNGLAWLNLVQTDLEGADYAVGVVDLCAAGFGAPHWRQRLFFVADTDPDGCNADALDRGDDAQHNPQSRRQSSVLEHPQGDGRQPRWAESDGRCATRGCGKVPGPVNGFWADAEWRLCTDDKFRSTKPGLFPLAAKLPAGMGRLCAGSQRMAALAGLDAGSLQTAKSHRIGALRGYGNAINAEVATGFIRAYREVSEDR